MKSKWSRFWGFSIQFFIVVLGVFITLWLSGINERTKENRKTRQALEMISQELQEYNELLLQKSDKIKEESEVYKKIMRYTIGEIPLPSEDSLIRYMNVFRSFSQDNVRYLSLEIAEKSGAINNIKDLNLISSIYSSYGYITLFYQIQNEKEIFKLEKIRNNINPQNSPLLLLGSGNSLEPDIASKIWEEITHNQDLFSTAVNGSLQTDLLLSAINIGSAQATKTVAQINNYLKHPNVPRGTN